MNGHGPDSEFDCGRLLSDHTICKVSLDDCVITRYCFMTGEYCSQQYNIQKARDELHQKNQISAFVIMSFSDMSDVVYKWRIKPFVESLTKHMRINTHDQALYCFPDINAVQNQLDNNVWTPVDKINVVRSDSEPASNYVICNRICQQLQIADLVVVDLSSQNPNVMYEFGMAVALKKLILPMCFSESFYHREVPSGVKNDTTASHHMGCYPWRKSLFEYYGILYCQEKKSTRYLSFEDATNDENGFYDRVYARFPYTDHVGSSEVSIGQMIYEKLGRTYNTTSPKDNTLVVYTMESFLNEGQAASCICTFYKNVTAKLQEEECFCGDRVGVLVQAQAVFQEDKDAGDTEIPYNIGEIIRIGVNQATYLSEDKKVRPADMLSDKQIWKWCSLGQNDAEISQNSKVTENICRFVKTHICNRGMIIYPNHPVYVDRIKRGQQYNFLSDDITDDKKQFCLFHVMLQNLKYVNQVVVDISNNALHGLFWLGVAHGSDIHAITVKHETTKLDKPSPNSHENKRNVFDVSGLWTAIYHSHDTDGFYHQLALVQAGIERHSRLMLSDTDSIFEKVKNTFQHNDEVKSPIQHFREEYTEQQNEILESFYRNAFWKPILCYNKLRMYVGQVIDKGKEDQQVHLRVAQWDFDAVSALTHYLSKHTPIGEYVVMAPTKDSISQEGTQVNSLYIGNASNNATDSWLKKLDDDVSKWPKNSYLNDIPRLNELHIYFEHEQACLKPGIQNKVRIERGFYHSGSNQRFTTRHALTTCLNCQNSKSCFNGNLNENAEHDQLAQLVLWRSDSTSKSTDNQTNDSPMCQFKAALIGSSGPATFGLSALFVDKKHQLYSHTESRDTTQPHTKERNLLCNLQAEVRDRFIHIYLNLLKAKLSELIPTCQGSEHIRNTLISNVCYCVSAYLSATLYKFFFPFVTNREQKQILNGMHTYITAFRSAGVEAYPRKNASNGVALDTIETYIMNALTASLAAFVGVEAFYQVTVDHQHSTPLNSSTDQVPNTDRRRAKKITLVKQEGKPDIEDECGKTGCNSENSTQDYLVYCFINTETLEKYGFNCNVDINL